MPTNPNAIIDATLRAAVAMTPGERVLELREPDAATLPFADATFDIVVSAFGVMFAVHQERAASELLRVLRPGGRIGLANWTPESFVGQVLKIVNRYVPPPSGLRAPTEWGTHDRLQELVGPKAHLVTRPREYVFESPGPRAWLDTFRAHDATMRKTFAALDGGDQTALERDLLALAGAYNTSEVGALRIPTSYLEAVAIKR